MKMLRSLVHLCLLGVLIIASATSLLAQEANEVKGDKPVSTSPEKTQEGAPAEPVSNPPPLHQLDRGDNAWILVSSALVLFMTTPGLAMFYGGLVRKKNVVSVLMQCVFLMRLMTVLWATVGYSLAFGGSETWIGNGDYLFMKGVQAT